MGFALGLALRRLADAQEQRPLLWCRLAGQEREYGRLYGHGLERLGLSRQRFVTVTKVSPRQFSPFCLQFGKSRRHSGSRRRHFLWWLGFGGSLTWLTALRSEASLIECRCGIT